MKAFSSTPSRKLDVARVTLIGRLGRDPELRVTKSDKEYVTCVLPSSFFFSSSFEF
jgi:single-stranded DNA-binding protein